MPRSAAAESAMCSTTSVHRIRSKLAGGSAESQMLSSASCRLGRLRAQGRGVLQEGRFDVGGHHSSNRRASTGR